MLPHSAFEGHLSSSQDTPVVQRATPFVDVVKKTDVLLLYGSFFVLRYRERMRVVLAKMQAALD